MLKLVCQVVRGSSEPLIIFTTIFLFVICSGKELNLSPSTVRLPLRPLSYPSMSNKKAATMTALMHIIVAAGVLALA